MVNAYDLNNLCLELKTKRFQMNYNQNEHLSLTQGLSKIHFQIMFITLGILHLTKKTLHQNFCQVLTIFTQETCYI